MYRGTSRASAVTPSGYWYPTLSTQRFQFRAFVLTDIAPWAALAGERRIAGATIGVPHPYTRELARLWIVSHPVAWKRRLALHWAARKVGEERIAGYAGLSEIDMNGRQAELRCWVGCGVERKRDAIEWSTAIVDFALMRLNLNRVYALQIAGQARMARILATIGMQREGFLRKRICRDDRPDDWVCWAIERSRP